MDKCEEVVMKSNQYIKDAPIIKKKIWKISILGGSTLTSKSIDEPIFRSGTVQWTDLKEYKHCAMGTIVAEEIDV